MLSNRGGNYMLVSERQLKNALLLIVFSSLPYSNITSFNYLHPLNAYSLISTTLFAIVTLYTFLKRIRSLVITFVPSGIFIERMT